MRGAGCDACACPCTCAYLREVTDMIRIVSGDCGGALLVPPKCVMTWDPVVSSWFLGLRDHEAAIAVVESDEPAITRAANPRWL